MIRAAIEKIIELSGFKTVDVGTKTYSDRELYEVREPIDKPAEIELTSIDALVQMVKKEALALYSPAARLFITVPRYDTIKCFTDVDMEERYTRFQLYQAKATDVPGWNEEVRLPFEQAGIALQTRFQRTSDQEYALRLLSQITAGGKVTYNDNGIATTVVSQKGVALQTNEVIRPIINLKPYRTFQEIDQPESQFLIRIDERGITFIGADGGMWKLAARREICRVLTEALKVEIEEGLVVVAL